MKNNKKLIIGIVVIIIVAIVAVVALSKPKPIIIESNDGQATLEIAKSSLPKDVDLSSVKIMKLDSENTMLSSKDGDKFQVFDLQPDGLAFSEEAIFKTSFKNSDGKLPIFFHISEDAIEPISNVKYVIRNDTITANVPVTHFSGLGYHPDGVMFSFTAYANDTQVNEFVEGEGMIIVQNTTYSAVVRGKNPWDDNYDAFEMELIEGTLEVEGEIKGVGPVSPNKAKDKPPKSGFQKNFKIPTKTDFKCKKPGKASLTFTDYLNWEGSMQVTGGISLVGQFAGSWREYATLEVQADFECLAIPPVIDITEGGGTGIIDEGNVEMSDLPKFEFHRGDPPATNYDYDLTDFQGKTEKEIKKMGKQLRISGFNYYKGGSYNHHFPFPYSQFNVDTRVYEEHGEMYGSYCANTHFDAEKALDIDLNWVPAPESVCGFGGPYYFVGAIIVTPKQVIAWLKAHGDL